LILVLDIFGKNYLILDNFGKDDLILDIFEKETRKELIFL
jgi:hypothetical protein